MGHDEGPRSSGWAEEPDIGVTEWDNPDFTDADEQRADESRHARRYE